MNNEIEKLDFSQSTLAQLRQRFWQEKDRDKAWRILGLIAEQIEVSIVSGARRWDLAEELRDAGYTHSELGMLRKWALQRGQLELDEVLAAIGSEIRGRAKP